MTPGPELSDAERVRFALAYQAFRRQTLPDFAVWIDEGRLSVREGLQGPRRRMCWSRLLADVRAIDEAIATSRCADVTARVQREVG